MAGITDGLFQFVEESIMVYVVVGIIWMTVIGPLLIGAFVNASNAATIALLLGLIPLLYAIGIVRRAIDSMKPRSEQTIQ